MVRGFEYFGEYFKDYSDCFVVIGGTACVYYLDQIMPDVRVTDDIDMVLILEAINPDFNKILLNFINEAEYKTIEKTDGTEQFYRFSNPKSDIYPKVIELFSRKPDMIDLTSLQYIVPVDLGDSLGYLSAILLHDDYYDLIKDHCTVIENVPMIELEYIIPLKARAFVDNTRRKDEGQSLRKDDILKHRRDIYKLALMLNPETKIILPEIIRQDISGCVEILRKENFNVKSIKISDYKKDDLIDIITYVYDIKE